MPALLLWPRRGSFSRARRVACGTYTRGLWHVYACLLRRTAAAPVLARGGGDDEAAPWSTLPDDTFADAVVVGAPAVSAGWVSCRPGGACAGSDSEDGGSGV